MSGRKQPHKMPINPCHIRLLPICDTSRTKCCNPLFVPPVLPILLLVLLWSNLYVEDNITKADWDCSELPATVITDMGSEYKSQNFEFLTEISVSVNNLNPYRPDLKSVFW